MKKIIIKNKYIIGDLHGNKTSYKKNLLKYDLIDSELNWKGGNNELYFLGDIIGDRCKEGLEILLEINKIKTQIDKVGGNMGLIAGNHEDYLFSFLGGLNLPGNHDVINTINLSNQGLGVEELLNKYSEKNYSLQDLINISNEDLKSLRKEILYNLNNSQEGKIIIDTMLNYKLVIKTSNLLLHHTNTTTNIVSLLNSLSFDYNKINNIYKKGIEDILFNNNIPDDKYFEIKNIFLSTNNRKYFWKEQAKLLKNQGIDNIIHGHTDNRGYNDEIGGINIYSADTSFGKPNILRKKPEAIIKIDKNMGLALPYQIN